MEILPNKFVYKIECDSFNKFKEILTVYVWTETRGMEKITYLQDIY